MNLYSFNHLYTNSTNLELIAYLIRALMNLFRSEIFEAIKNESYLFY